MRSREKPRAQGSPASSAASRRSVSPKPCYPSGRQHRCGAIARDDPHWGRNRLAHRRFANFGLGDDRLPPADQHAGDAVLRTPGAQLQRSAVADQTAPAIVVLVAQQGVHLHIDETGVAVPGLAVGEGKLSAFDDDTDKIRTVGEAETWSRTQPRAARSAPLFKKSAECEVAHTLPQLKLLGLNSSRRDQPGWAGRVRHWSLLRAPIALPT